MRNEPIVEEHDDLLALDYMLHLHIFSKWEVGTGTGYISLTLTPSPNPNPNFYASRFRNEPMVEKHDDLLVLHAPH